MVAGHKIPEMPLLHRVEANRNRAKKHQPLTPIIVKKGKNYFPRLRRRVIERERRSITSPTSIRKWLKLQNPTKLRCQNLRKSM